MILDKHNIDKRNNQKKGLKEKDKNKLRRGKRPGTVSRSGQF